MTPTPKQVKVEALLAAMGLKARYDEIIEAFKGAPGLDPTLLASIDTAQIVREVAVPIFERGLSLEDVCALHTFYSSPAGQRSLETLPRIAEQVEEAVQTWLNKKLKPKRTS